MTASGHSSPSQISRMSVQRSRAQCGAAILAVPIVDTVKQVGKRVRRNPPLRGNIWYWRKLRRSFKTALLNEAFESAAKDEYYGTDESSLVERLGHPVAIVRGSERNIKITRPS